MATNAYLFNYISTVANVPVKFGFHECDILQPNMREITEPSSMAKNHNGKENTVSSTNNSVGMVKRTGARGFEQIHYCYATNNFTGLISQRLMHFSSDNAYESGMPTADRMVTTLTSIGIDHGNPSKLKYPPV
ncbi:MAG: hypothetical protein EZS28_033198, partial [Streblomastix strix]